MNIGSKIKNLRTSNNLTTQQLADKIGVSRSQVSKIETGASMPSIEVLDAICNVLNITLSDFFNEGTDPIVLTPKLKELLDNAKDLTPEQLEALSIFIKTLK